MGDWRREFPNKYYEVDDMGYGYRAGNYIFEELLNQIKQLKAENEKLKEENEKLGFMLGDERNQQFHKETHEAVYGK